MAYQCPNVDEARSRIHLEQAGVLIPVPGSTRWVGVQDAGDGWMLIFTSRAGHILSSQALSVWGDQPLEGLVLYTDVHGGEYGPPHKATREEWEDLLHQLPHLMPIMTGQGYLTIYHDKNPVNSYDEVMGCLPPTLPRLVAERGVRVIRLSGGRVSGKAVLAFMAALHQEGWPVKAGEWGCYVGTPGGGVWVWLSKASVVGMRTTLEEARRLNPSPLDYPLWQEEEEGDRRYEDMRRQQFEVDFNKALEEGEAETCRGRLLLLGRAGAGKTSVKNALLGQDFISKHIITDLLDIQHATIDDGGTWQPLDEAATRQHDEHYLVALAVNQQKCQNESKGPEAATSMHQDAGTTAGNAGRAGPRMAISKKGKTGGAGIFKVIKKLFRPKAQKEQPCETRTQEELPHVVRKQEEVPAEVESLLQKGKKLERKDSVYVWDFAGQLIYYTVHQLFLTERTIIVLVTDGSNDLEAPIPPEYAQSSDFSLKTEKDYVEYFLKTSSIWGRSEGAQKPCQPPHAFILLNKADLVSPEKLGQRLQLVRKLVKATPAFDDMVRAVLPYTSKPVPDNEGCPQLISYEESHSKLKACIQQVRQDFVVKLPIKWLRLRNKLQEKPHTTFQNAVDIARSLHIEANIVKSVLQYFHQHRELVYWDTEGCRDFIVCQPNWFINEMRKIISVKDNQIHERYGSPGIAKLLDMLNDEKILNEGLAEELWEDNHKVMIEIMQKYLLLLPWTKDQFGRQQYLVPCLLEAIKDTVNIPHGEDIPPIFFFLHDKVMPIGLTSRLVTLLATTEGWNDGDELPTICFNGAQFILKEKNTYVSITLQEKLWKPCIGEEWKDKRERMKEQTVIRVRAGLTSEINKEVMSDTSCCLNRARETIQAGIKDILSMINVSQPVITAEESPCKHKLLPPETRVCNICHKSYGCEVYGAWYGQELTLQQQDTTYASPGAGRGLKTGELSQFSSHCYQNKDKFDASTAEGFVVDEKTLEIHLVKMVPELTKLVKVNYSLVANLQARDVLDIETEQQLNLPCQTDIKKVKLLMDHIKKHIKGRFLPLLQALEATNQTGAIAALDTEEIRDCLNL